MTEMKPSTIVVGLLMFTLVIIGFFLFVGDMGSKYGVEEDITGFKTMFDKSSELIELSNDSAKQLIEAGTPQTSYQSLFSLGGWKAMIKIIRNIPSIIDGLLRGVAEEFGIPESIVVLIMAVVLITLSAAIIGAIFGRAV